MKSLETDRLVAELEALPPYNGWRFTYEYPGYFCCSHPDLPYRVAFAPDGEAVLFVEVPVVVLPLLPHEGRTGQQLLDLARPTLDKLQHMHAPGTLVPPPALGACMWCGGDSEHGQCAPCSALLDAVHAAPAAGLAAIVAATRSKEGPLDLHVSLTADEVAALKDAHDHVRAHMAHQHPWVVRDAAMIGIGKVLTAAREAQENR